MSKHVPEIKIFYVRENEIVSKMLETNVFITGITPENGFIIFFENKPIYVRQSDLINAMRSRKRNQKTKSIVAKSWGTK